MRDFISRFINDFLLEKFTKKQLLIIFLSLTLVGLITYSYISKSSSSKANQTTQSANSDDFSVDDLDAKDDVVDQVEDVTDEQLNELPEPARKALKDIFDATSQAYQITNQYSYTVQKGDTLSKILDDAGLNDNVVHQLVKQYPAFNRDLKEGQQIYWTLYDDGRLRYLNWIISYNEERLYIRMPNNTFKEETFIQKGDWRTEVLHGKINQSFSRTFLDMGLNASVAAQATSALQWQTNMKRLQKGDKFALVVLREYLHGKPTGRADVQAIHLITGGRSYYAIRAENKSFYDEDGYSTGKGFERYPFKVRPRVSSSFNLRRRHPITGRISPHFGVDFAMPMRTPVYSPADGVVQKVAYQSHGAGHYIIIRHSRKYKTVYMHLNRSLVRAGDRVQRGQIIALSGNSGRSTGPHLHYEFRIDEKPWNPLSVKLPKVNTNLTRKEKKQFLALVKEMKKKLAISKD